MEVEEREESCSIFERIPLPPTLKIQKFIKARFQEIEALTEAIENPERKCNLFQQLPKHMRRRVMSHSSKRIPNHLKDSQRTSAEVEVKKRPRNKYRKRSRKGSKDYTRRQEGKKWLETHIWHGKRFKMENLWGYRLPVSPRDKSFRACYRAMAHHCLIQDLSYMECLEVVGKEEVLLEQLNQLVGVGGLTFRSAAFLQGVREGSCTLYRRGEVERKFLGEIRYLWRPRHPSLEHRTLWIWTHPSSSAEILLQLTSLLDDQDKGLVRRLERLVRLRLTGPLSTQVLAKVALPSDAESPAAQVWARLSRATSPDVLSPHIVLSLDVIDPRFNFPSKRTKALPSSTGEETGDSLEVSVEELRGLRESRLWSPEERETLTQSKLSTAQLGVLNQVKLVPGTGPPPGLVPLPNTAVLLIQRPHSSSGVGAGWDVVAARGWAMPFWLAAIFWGARAGGLRESATLEREEGVPEQLPPDCDPGAKQEAARAAERAVSHFGRPPSKRPNYIKLGVSAPFGPAWAQLIGTHDFFVLRCPEKLRKLSLYLKKILKENIDFSEEELGRALVGVSISCLGRGKMEEPTMICLPESEDFIGLEADAGNGGPVEPPHPDHQAEERVQTRAAHRQLLKRLRRQRRKASSKTPSSTEAVASHRERMEGLWLPEGHTPLFRKLIGYTTNGAFRFSRGRSGGLGYVTLSSLVRMSSPKVLMRSPTTLQYRWGTLDVILQRGALRDC